MAEPIRTEYAPETEEDDGSIVGRSLGFLGDVLKGIPGVYPAYKAVMWSGEAFGGAGSATLRVGRDILKEEGVGTFLKETAIEALPFSGSAEYTGRYRKILSIDEEDGLKDRMNKARAWQQERDSAFWGEKFLSEVLFDPLTYVPIGTVVKGVKAVRPSARAARRAARAEELAAAPPKIVPSNLAREHEFADILPVTPATAADFPENTLSRLTRWTVRHSGIPYIHKAVNLVNPTALIRGALGFDKGAKIGVRHLRTQKMIDSVTDTDIVPIKAQGKTSKIFPGMYTADDGNLYVKIAKKPPRRPKGAKPTKEAPVEADVKLEEVFERPGRYDLSKAQDLYIKTALKIITAWKDRAIAEGVDVKELRFLDDKHYFPRFVEMIRDIAKTKKGGGASGLRKNATPLEQRLYDEIEEAVQNGVVYFGARSDDPIADILMTYMRSLGRVIAHTRVDKEIKEMGSEINDRIIGRYGGGGAAGEVTKTKQQWERYGRAHNILTKAINAVSDLRVREEVLPKDFLSSNERDFLKKLGGNAAESGGDVFVAKLDKALRATTKASQLRQLNAIREIVKTDLGVALYAKEDARLALKALKAQVKNPWELQPMPNWVGGGAYAGYLFDPEDVKGVIPFLSTTEQTLGVFAPGLKLMSTLAGISRTAMLTFDFGAGLLQGAMVLTKSPKTWINATRRSLHSWADPTVRYKYLQKKLDVLATYKNLHIGSTEMTEVLRPGGQLARVFGHVPGARLPTKTAQRFATSFETFFDVARIEMAEAFLPAVRRGHLTPDQVASHLNKMTGVLSSRSLGISATQRELESAAFTLAPRWFRSTIALFADGVQGGWEGGQARRAISRFFGGTVLTYVGIVEGLNQLGYDVELKLDPRPKKEGGNGFEFMTVEIGGQHIGLAGKPYSMVRTLVKMASDPENQGHYAQNFLRGQSAPPTSALWDILSGETFLGEPVRTPSEIVRQGIGTRFMPFYLDAYLNDDPRPGAVALPAEMVGMRTTPVLPRERLETIQDELAAYVTRLTPDQKRRMEEEGMDVPTWDILSITQRHSIQRDAAMREGVPKENRNIPDDKLDEFKTYDERVRKWGAGKSDSFGVRAFMNELEDAREDLRLAGNKRQKEYDDGMGGPRKFLDDMRMHQRDFGKAMDTINAEDGANGEAIAYFKKKNADKEYIPLQDFVYSAYIEELVQNPDLMDSYGNFDFEERDRKERALRLKYGSDLIDEIERDLQAKKDMPPLWRRWLQDREILKPYWELRDRYLRSHHSVRSLMRRIERAKNRRDTREVKRLQQHPDYRRMEREIRAEKDALRERDPRLDGALVFWEYASQVRTEEAYRYLR